ncbi:MAG TPA: glycosyltransferase family 39 protein [Rudaea sp.]
MPAASRSSFMNSSWLRRFACVVAIVAYALLFQGARAIYSPDEGRYTDVALQMLDDGDWLRPKVHPEFEHWSKPPLTYWAIAASVSVFGRNEFAARLPNALAFAATIVLLLRVGRRVSAARPWLPAFVYATFAFPFAAANIVTTDTLLALWETLQFVAFVELWFGETPRAGDRRLLWAGAALAFMTKGPPGLLVLCGCLVYAAIDRDRGRWRALVSWDAVLIFCVLGFSWYAVEVIRNPQLLHYFFVDEVVNRVATDKMHRNGAWYDGFRIYLPTLLLGTLPWLPFAALRHRSASLRETWKQSALVRLLCCAIVVPLVVFMISRSRLPLYILPLFAPLACLVAYALRDADFSATRTRALLAAWCVFLVAARGFMAHVPLHDDDRRLAEALRRVVPMVPGEIAFVETAPRYGLRFYLGSSIERLTLPGRRTLPEAEDFAQEMLEDEGCRVLMVDPGRLDPTIRAMDSLPLRYKRLGDVEGYAVFAQKTPDCESYAAL